MLSGTTFLVTGATGQLGCNTVQRLEDLGAGVIPLVLEGYSARPKRESWTARTEPVMASLPEHLDSLPVPDHVINFHWRIGNSPSPTEELLHQIDCNLHRPAFLWDWLKTVRPQSFVNISTVKVFSSLNVSPVASCAEPRPNTPYGIAKLCAEKFFDSHFQGMECRVAHLRLCSVTSAGEHPAKMLSRLYAGAFGQERIRVNAGHSTYLLYVDDVVDRVINTALSARSGRYTLASEPIAIHDLVSLFEKISGRRVNAEYVDLAPGAGDLDFISDVGLLAADWARSTTLEEAVGIIISQKRQAGSPSKPEPHLTSGKTSEEFSERHESTGSDGRIAHPA